MSGGKSVFLKAFVVISYLAMVVVNALANILPLNGIGTGAVSDSYPNLFAPTGFTFLIWSLIYLLLALHVLYQLGLFRNPTKTNDVLLWRVGIVFSVSSLINIAWIFSWHFKLIFLSMILMILLLLSLIFIAMIIRKQKLDTRDRFFIRLPFSVYFGWITVATIANATTLLVSLNWNGFGLSSVLWTIIILAIGTLIGVVTTRRFNDIAYGLVLIWAYLGILYKHVSTSGFGNQYPDVVTAVIVCLIVLVLVLLYTCFVIVRKKIKWA